MGDHSRYPSLGVIILNWNSYEDVVEVLNSISQSKYEEIKIVVVDNGSLDNSGRQIQKDYQEIEVIFAGENLGFSAGNNLGIKYLNSTKVDYICLLNNDIKFYNHNVFTELVDSLETEPNIGIISPKILEYPGTDKYWFKQGKINWNVGVFYHGKNRRWYIHGLGKSNSQATTSILDNDFVPFACAVFRASIFKEIGLLREEYFLYVEDIDYCTRVLDAGYRVVTKKDSVVYHKKESNSSLSPLRTYYRIRNRYIWAKNFKQKINQPLFYLSYIYTSIMFFFHRLLQRDLSSAAAVLRGFFDAIQGNTGKGPYP